MTSQRFSDVPEPSLVVPGNQSPAFFSLLLGLQGLGKLLQSLAYEAEGLDDSKGAGCRFRCGGHLHYYTGSRSGPILWRADAGQPMLAG